MCPGLLQRLCCDFEPWIQALPAPSSSSHCPTPLLLYTSPKACSLNTPSPQHPHMKKCHRHTYTYASTHASKHSYPIFTLHSDGMPEETLHPSILTLCLSLFRFSESRGVISNGELIINSIKWVWLPWQIGLGYNIIISASSAVTTGHGGQMGLGLIGRVDVVTLKWSKSWVCLCRDEQLECDFLYIARNKYFKGEMDS